MMAADDILKRNAKDLQKKWKQFLREQKKNAKQSKPEKVQKNN